MEITYQEVREEVENLVKTAIEEAMKDAGDEDELREKVQDVLHEMVDVLARRPEITDPADFLKCILERERLISTGRNLNSPPNNLKRIQTK